jgi:hypothetical protein
MKTLYLVFIVITLSQLVSASSQASYGSVQLYGDSDCTQAKGNVTQLEVNSCLETNQSSAIAAVSFPSCGNFQAILDISDQDHCRPPSLWPPTSSGNVGDCLSFVTGSDIGSARFICVGSVTTAAPHSTGQGTLTPSLQSVQTVSHTSTSSISSPAAPSRNPAPSDGGLSQSDKVAIGVSIGLAALFATSVGVLYARRSTRISLLPQNIRWVRNSGPDVPPPYSEFQMRRVHG